MIRLARFVRNLLMYVNILILLIGILSVINAASSNFWPSTKGKIETLKVCKRQNKGRQYYDITLIYSYYADNIKYTSKRFSWGFISSDDFDYISNYINDQTQLMVYYNPILHSESVLKTGFGFFSTMPFLLLLITYFTYCKFNAAITKFEIKRG